MLLQVRSTLAGEIDAIKNRLKILLPSSLVHFVFFPLLNGCSPYTANSITVVLLKALTVNCERSRDDWSLLIFTSKFGIISSKQHIGI